MLIVGNPNAVPRCGPVCTIPLYIFSIGGGCRTRTCKSFLTLVFKTSALPFGATLRFNHDLLTNSFQGSALRSGNSDKSAPNFLMHYCLDFCLCDARAISQLYCSRIVHIFCLVD